MAGIRQAIDLGDQETVRSAAHTLKGSAANFGAEPTEQAAFRLQEIAESRNLAGGDRAYQLLQMQMDRLKTELSQFAEEDLT